MRYTIGEICKITGAKADGLSLETGVEGWSIDSRTVQRGDIYFSIVGENHDGHKFAPDSLAKGASAAVVRHDYRFPGKVNGGLLRCGDPLEVMHSLASHSRNEEGLRLVGITGSCGKTTTKDITAALLGSRLKTGKNKGNLNNIWGLPLGLLRRPVGLDIYVCEMGMSLAGELSGVTRIGRPEVAVFTNIHGVHLMNFKSVREIAEAKAEILEGVPPDGVVVANADDPEVMRITHRSGLCTVTFGIENSADLTAAGIEDRGINGLSFELRLEGRTISIAAPLPGMHNLQNVLAAFATCTALGFTPEDVMGGLNNLDMSPARTQLVRFADGWTLYDDTYNSNPQALRLTLETIKRSNGYQRRIAVLGDMLELGPGEEEEHVKAGRMIAGMDLDRLIVVGPLARHMAASALEAGMDPAAIKIADNKEAVIEVLDGQIRPGDLILIKGSRGVKMETIVEELTRRHPAAQGSGEGSKGR
ncbi:MAG TPA: UDP-N-acetylmuramoyl-tripeptide--D-alanyl-D-alanine ligase [Acidobacteriota bacterium]|nr:UDP-N-acetylmuramoyl-tripeptide--D-alanyl-D-alanine ligase [Acidobacteriota bacterium]